jgi:hypothetical protein
MPEDGDDPFTEHHRVQLEWAELQHLKAAARPPKPAPTPPKKPTESQSPMTPNTAPLDWGKGGRKIYK